MFERTVRILRQCFSEIIVATNSPEKYDGFHVKIATDEFRTKGPLAGMHAAFGVTRCSHAFVVACDMPFLHPEPIAMLLRYVDDSDAVIPWWDGDIEPLHAVYATSLRGPIELALANGTSAIRDFLPTIRVTYLPESLMRGVPGADEAFRNVNTPQDAERYAVEIEGKGRGRSD